MTDNNINNNNAPTKPTEKKGLLQNIYFVGFLLVISLLDFVRHAINYDYNIANIIFIAVAAFLFFKILKDKKKLQP